jgi:glycosyltransferase involved in cell wall biosynthesis
VQVILRAAGRLKDELPRLRVWVAGDGEYLAELKLLADQQGLNGRIEFFGWTSQDELFRRILQADLGIVPILGGYGELMLPNKLFEYVALGRPVVSSALHTIQFYFTDRIAYFPPDDDAALARQIQSLSSHPDQRAHLASLAAPLIEAYGWENTSQIYVHAVTGQ